jgi:hypothetical protein
LLLTSAGHQQDGLDPALTLLGFPLVYTIHPFGGWRIRAVSVRFQQGETNMPTLKKLLDLFRSEEETSIYVLPVIHGGFGVYANKVLLAIHTDQSSAEAHCLRLRSQQTSDIEI